MKSTKYPTRKEHQGAWHYHQRKDQNPSGHQGDNLCNDDRLVHDVDLDHQPSTAIGSSALRVLLIGVCLSLLHIAGIVVALFVLAKRLSDPYMPDKPVYRVCTTAALCPFYWILGGGLASASIQLVGSVLGLALNLLVVLGALNGVSWAVLTWLLCYSLAICGCIIFFGALLNTLIVRDAVLDDVHYSTMILATVPAFMAVLYLVCWCVVFRYWRNLRRRDTRVFDCVE